MKKLQALVQQCEEGQITDAGFDRRSRQFWIELKHRDARLVELRFGGHSVDPERATREAEKFAEA